MCCLPSRSRSRHLWSIFPGSPGLYSGPKYDPSWSSAWVKHSFWPSLFACCILTTQSIHNIVICLLIVGGRWFSHIHVLKCAVAVSIYLIVKIIHVFISDWTHNPILYSNISNISLTFEFKVGVFTGPLFQCSFGELFLVQLSPLELRFLTLFVSFCCTVSQSATSLSLSQSVNITWLHSFPMSECQPVQLSFYKYLSW